MDNVTAVKENADIVDFIKNYVQLKKAGVNYKGKCPFHNEKTPSFMVNPDLQIYKCFGCGKSGDVLTFAMEIEGLEFYDALKMLADKYGVVLKHNDKSNAQHAIKAKLFEINDLAMRYYSDVLLRHEVGTKALTYLKNRGIKVETVRDFKIGYAPNAWRSVSKMLMERGYAEEDIILAGLAKRRKSGGIYDVYRDRVIFPLISPVGKVVGFAGRSLSSDVNPKYLNTSQTPVFHKDRFLFGLNLSKLQIKRSGVAILAEGIFDMISPYQAGFQNIIASQGTALTTGQVNLLERYAEKVVLLFDNDVAGIGATLRGIDLINQSSLEVKVAMISGGFKDPDDLAIADPKQFKDVIDNAVFIGDFYLFYVKKQFDLSNIYQKSKAVAFLVSKLRQMSDDIVRSEYIKKYSAFLDVDEHILMSKVHGSLSSTKKGKKKNASKVNDGNSHRKYPANEKHLISLLLKCDYDLFGRIISNLKHEFFASKELGTVFTIIRDFRLNNTSNSESFDFKGLYDKLRTVIVNNELLNSLFLTEFEDLISDSTFVETELTLSAERLRKDYLQRRRRFLSREIKKAEMLSDFDRVSVLNKEFYKITKELS